MWEAINKKPHERKEKT